MDENGFSSRSARSLLMGSIRAKDTKPEMVVRRLAHAIGYRFRIHRKDLPGSPDLVLPGRRAVVFVHGCFWHRHEGCRLASTPKSNEAFWQVKFERNVIRDARKERELHALGWKILVVWECETKDTKAVAERLQEFLGPVGAGLVTSGGDSSSWSRATSVATPRFRSRSAADLR